MPGRHWSFQTDDLGSQIDLLKQPDRCLPKNKNKKCLKIPHPFIYATMYHYHISLHIKRMITSRLGGIPLQFKTVNFIARWQNLEEGIITECTVSPIFFVMGINLLITAAEQEVREPVMESGIQHPPVQGFMTHMEARLVLTVLDRVLMWA